MDFKFRFRYVVLGGHTHIRMFAGPSKGTTLGLCGSLVMRNEEWEEFWKLLPEKGVEIRHEEEE